MAEMYKSWDVQSSSIPQVKKMCEKQVFNWLTEHFNFILPLLSENNP